MPDANLTDTDKRIVMKDHDILIQLTTQMAELIRRFDENVRYQMEQDKSYALEMKSVAVEQARVTSDLKSVHDEQAQMSRRIEKLENKSNIWDLVNSFGVAVSLAIGYFFGRN